MKDFAWMNRHFAKKKTESNKKLISKKHPSHFSALERTTLFECQVPDGKGLVLNIFWVLGFFSSPPALRQILEDPSSLCTPKS